MTADFNLVVGEITAIVPIIFFACIMYFRQVGFKASLNRWWRRWQSVWRKTEEYIQHTAEQIIHPPKKTDSTGPPPASQQPPPLQNGAQPPSKPEKDEKGQNSTEETEILYGSQSRNTGFDTSPDLEQGFRSR